MRILWSIHLYPPVHNSGSEYVAHHLNKYLIEKGHQVRVLLHYADQNEIETPYMYEGVECMGGNVCNLLSSYLWADVIMTHLDVTQYTIVMSHEAKRPLIHFVHNDIAYECIQNRFSQMAAVYNSDWIAKKLAYDIPSTTLHPPCDRKMYETQSSRDHITLINLNERKGGWLFYQIARAMPHKKFIGAIGSYENQGPLKKSRIDIVNALMLLPNVTILPNSPDIVSVYAKTGILLMPSDYESWGRTATEAMCSGIPVICTPTPGLKENCQDAAIYVGRPVEETEPGQAQVDPGSVQEWVEAISLLDDPVIYDNYSLLCRQRASQHDPSGELENLEKFIIGFHESYHRLQDY